MEREKMEVDKEKIRVGERKYPLQLIEEEISNQLENLTGFKKEARLVETPSHLEGSDYGFHLGKIAGEVGWGNPKLLSEELSKFISKETSPFIVEIKPEGPYLNFSLEFGKFGNEVVNKVLEMGSHYGKENIGKGRVVVVDMSSPNIAKLMNYGHLRSTIIGDAIANIYRTEGFEVIRDNHIGDWGTQFGNLITAIKKWGDEKKLFSSDDPIDELRKLYEKFHKEEEKEYEAKREKIKKIIDEKGIKGVEGLQEAIEGISKEIMERKKIGRDKLEMGKIIEDALDEVTPPAKLTIEGRNWFSKLEKGDKEARRLWKLCVDVSLKEFNKIYKVLGVDFEKTLGESFYEKLMPEVIKDVRKKVGKMSEGALVVDLKDRGLGVSIVQKSDGGTVYMTRDLATAIYRQNELNADRALYVVGEDQKHYFSQLFEILKMMDEKIGKKSEHVYFGLVSLPEGKMSSRKGRIILLKDVISEGNERVKSILEEKKPGKLENDKKLKEKVVRQLAVGALKWNDLAQHRKVPVKFDWDKALNLQGNSAPYVQYAAVRARSILEKENIDWKNIKTVRVDQKISYKKKSEKELIKKLASYPGLLQVAYENNDPSKITTFVYELAQKFNVFYNTEQVIIKDNELLMNSRLKLVAASYQVIANALGILGIEVPEAM